VDARGVVLTLHILAGASWIGSSVYSSFAYPRHAVSRTLGDTYGVEERLTRSFVGAAMALVLVTGVILVLMSSTFGFADAFVIIGVLAIVVRVGLEGGLFLPAIRRAVSREAEGSAAGEPLMNWSPLFDLALFGFVVWAMVTKVGV
jgi:hypothetical protein